MNYLGIPNNCEAKFTYEEFAIPKVRVFFVVEW